MLKIKQITSDSADIAHRIQKSSYEPLLAVYHDYDISPAIESIEQIREKMKRPNTTSYLFQLDNIDVGWVRVAELDDRIFKISALSVIPEYQNKGIAQEALKQIEKYHFDARKWILVTILQEKRNCHLYEKMGYVKTGEIEQINERMTLVSYEKYVVHD
jgi:RimJ/RimL family protein N-acetyltransferase